MKELIPSKIKNILKFLIYKYNSSKSFKKHQKKILEIKSKLKNQDKVNIIFLVIHESIWKYQEIYKLFHSDGRFLVKIAIIPHVDAGKVNFDTYNSCKSYFSLNGYDILDTYDEENNTWIDIKFNFNPDIVFFTNPHNLTFEKYYIKAFRSELTCYVPYAFVVIDNIEMHYNQPIFSMLWRYYLETDKHLIFAKKYLTNKHGLLKVTGYPSLDRIYSKNYKPKSVWKTSNDEQIRIIWAPHHTIEGQGENLNYSSFLNYSDYFHHLIETRKDIYFVFKPHPLLKGKLYNHNAWGKLRTDEYYNKWDSSDNAQIEEGEYIDLFYSSDAMIMDSASFLAEYLYFRKPLLFTKNDRDVQNRFNSFGRKIFSVIYEAYDQFDIENFIEEILIKKNDKMSTKRDIFLKNFMLVDSDETASDRIYTEIINELT